MNDTPTVAPPGNIPDETSVLILDANSSNRLLLSEMVCDLCMKPVTVADATLALSIIQHVNKTGNPFQLVILAAEFPSVADDGFVDKIFQQIGVENARVIMIHKHDSGVEENDERRMINIRWPFDISAMKDSINKVFLQWPIEIAKPPIAVEALYQESR